MFGISWLVIQFYFSSSNITQPLLFQTLDFYILKSEHVNGKAANPPPPPHAVTEQRIPSTSLWGPAGPLAFLDTLRGSSRLLWQTLR